MGFDLTASGQELARLWNAIPDEQRGRRTCALVGRIRNDPAEFTRKGAVVAAAKRIRPKGAGKDWDAFFKGLAEFMLAIAPLFVK